MICFEAGSYSVDPAALYPQTVCLRLNSEIEHMRYQAWMTRPEEKPAAFPCCCMHTSKTEGEDENACRGSKFGVHPVVSRCPLYLSSPFSCAHFLTDSKRTSTQHICERLIGN